MPKRPAQPNPCSSCLGLFYLRGCPAFAALLLACITDPGFEPATDAGRGNIIVWEKNGLPARVFLDYRSAGGATPLTLQNVPAGRHIIHVFSENYLPIPASKSVEVKERGNSEAEFELQKWASGVLSVETAPPGATVSVNSVDYGTSPLVIRGLPAGSYAIAAQLQNKQADTMVTVAGSDSTAVNLSLRLARFVTIEYFSNTGCAGCPAAGGAIDHLLDALPQYKEMLYNISYHANFPDPNDPFYAAAKNDQTARVTHYRAQVLPMACINGTAITYANESSFIADAKKQIEAAFATPASAGLSFDDLRRDSLALTGRLSVTNGQGKLLFIALTEDFIGYPVPPGNNGQKLFHAIFRGFAAEANGLPIIETEQSVTFSFDMARIAYSDLSVVAFVQNSTGNELVQSLRAHVP